MFWTLAVISLGIVNPIVAYVGNFQEEAACQKALADLKSQNIPYKVACVPIQPTTTQSSKGAK